MLNFFQAMASRKYAEAEKALSRINRRIQTTEWHRGYVNALKSMLLALRNNEEMAYIVRLSSQKSSDLGKIKRAFSTMAQRSPQDPKTTDYDRGFFLRLDTLPGISHPAIVGQPETAQNMTN
jgi:hypothetical protein